jgi:hypothetical protein
MTDAKQVAEKFPDFVIPSEARLPDGQAGFARKSQEKKADPSGKPRPSDDNLRVFPLCSVEMDSLHPSPL